MYLMGTMKTLNKDGTPRKQGSGRKKGANSFANVTLADLEQFCGSATLIPVSRVWLEKMGASITEANQTNDEIRVSLAIFGRLNIWRLFDLATKFFKIFLNFAKELIVYDPTYSDYYKY